MGTSKHHKTLTWYVAYFSVVAVEEETAVQGWQTSLQFEGTTLVTCCTMLLQWSRKCRRGNQNEKQNKLFKKVISLKCLSTEIFALKNTKFCILFQENHPDTSQLKRQVWFYSTGPRKEANTQKGHPLNQIKSLVSPFEPTTVILFSNDSNQSSDQHMLVSTTISGENEYGLNNNWAKA